MSAQPASSAPAAAGDAGAAAAAAAPQKPFQTKLVLLGEAAVGKSSVVLRFVQNDFQENKEPTIGAAFLTQKCRLEDRLIKFEIWDTAGQERFHSLAPMYYRNAQASAVIYDVTKASSFEKAKSWVKELQRQANVLGSGYFLYRQYDYYSRRLHDIQRELANEREADELIKAQIQAHFENIQRIADTTTLPHAIQHLHSRIEEDLDLSHLTERLMMGKGQPNTLTLAEKLDLWENLKILSFTKMVISLWAITVLSLYIRVQVNILGRHMYIDTARGLGSSHLLEEADLIDRDDQQKFLAISDFLCNYGLNALIPKLQVAVGEVLKRKQLRDVFNTTVLRETTIQIIKIFMSTGSPHHWLDYLMPGDNQSSIADTPSTDDDTAAPNFNKFDQLMMETRAVLLSAEFGNIFERSLEVGVGGLMEEMEASLAGGSSRTSGIPLARLVPRVAQMGLLLLEDPIKSRFIQMIRGIPEVEIFFTLLYANMPAS